MNPKDVTFPLHALAPYTEAPRSHEVWIYEALDAVANDLQVLSVAVSSEGRVSYEAIDKAVYQAMRRIEAVRDTVDLIAQASAPKMREAAE
jgi:hypothetical protein